MSPPRAIVAGPGAVRALRSGRRGEVEIAFGPGGYVRLGEDRILLAPARAPLGPLSLLIAGLPRAGVAAGARATVSDGVLIVGTLRIGLGAMRTSAVSEPVRLEPGWEASLAAALACVAPAAPALAAGLSALEHDELGAATGELAGRGEGLTPAGDDVLAGYAAWRWAEGDPVAPDDGRCAPLGRAYLRCARRGELPAPATRVLHAIRSGDARDAARRARGLSAWGASSGAALLWGMGAGARAQTGRTDSIGTYA